MGFMQCFQLKIVRLQPLQIKEFVCAKIETLDEYWIYAQYPDWGSTLKYDSDDGGDATGLLILGSKAEKGYLY